MPKGSPQQTDARRKVEVFRPGTFRAMNGHEFSFSEDDVAAMADRYDPATAPAPVVVGHPRHDDPAFGWAEGFEVNAQGVLVASLKELAPEFVEAVEAGRYRKVSMKFFAPDAPNNPAPGSYYPRHIGFLGGAAPAVSGLAPVQFAAAEDDELIEIVFAEPALEDVASLFRKLREFIIEKFSREDADEAVPEYLIRWVDQASDTPEPADAGFSETEERDTTMPDDTALAEREARIAAREAALNHGENLAFVDQLVAGNKLLPALKDRAVALLDGLAGRDGAEEAIAFSDDGKEVTRSPLALAREILGALPEAVPLGETDLGEAPEAASVAFAAPAGMTVDQDALALHRKALAYQNEHPGLDYLDAVKAVEG